MARPLQRVEDLKIDIDLSVLDDIKNTIIESNPYSNVDYGNYSTDGYFKTILYDNISPLIFNDFDELRDCELQSKVMPYYDFLQSKENQLIFSKFLGELNSKLIQHYGNEVLFRIEFTQLQPKSSMHLHKDVGRFVKDRLNIVFEDDDKSGFQCGDFLYPMKKNRIYKMDVVKLHRAVNNSDNVRHALILDVITNFTDLLEFKQETLDLYYNQKNLKDKLLSVKKIYHYLQLINK